MKRELILEYYRHYIDEVIWMYIRNYGRAMWLSPDQLTPYKSKTRIPWNEKKTDSYIIDSSNDKGILGRDIEDRGTFWPIFITKDRMVMMGSHRLEALQSIDSCRKLLCIELNDAHFDKNRRDKPKYEYRNPVSIDPVRIQVPGPVVIPEDSIGRIDEYILLKTNRWDSSDKFVEFEIKNFRDLMDIIRITPHWLKDYMYEEEQEGEKIKPLDYINDIAAFDRWINKEKEI